MTTELEGGIPASLNKIVSHSDLRTENISFVYIWTSQNRQNWLIHLMGGQPLITMMIVDANKLLIRMNKIIKIPLFNKYRIVSYK